MVDTTNQENLLLVTALTRYSYQFETAEPQVAERAWTLAVAIAAEYDLEPGEAVRQLE